MRWKSNQVVVACGLLALSLAGCGSDSDGDGAGGAGGATDATGIITDGATDAAPTDGGEGGMGGGGGEGGTPIVEPPIVERCPDAQQGEYLLVLFPDRVDAYRQRDFGAAYECKFLALAENGITAASGMAVGRDGRIFVVQPEDGRGVVYEFTGNGEFDKKVESNVNLAGVRGIWNTFGDDFITFSASSQNLYRLSKDGQFRGTFSPPIWQGSRVPAVTDMVFLAEESVIMTFSDRPAQIFLFPNAPMFPADQVGPGNAVAGVPTDEGTKIMMTAQVGGAGNGYGVMIYEPINVGREAAIVQEAVLVQASEIVDGKDLALLGAGMLVLDSALGGAAKITSFNAGGVLQAEIPLDGDGSPLMFTFAIIFPDF